MYCLRIHVDAHVHTDTRKHRYAGRGFLSLFSRKASFSTDWLVSSKYQMSSLLSRAGARSLLAVVRSSPLPFNTSCTSTSRCAISLHHPPRRRSRFATIILAFMAGCTILLWHSFSLLLLLPFLSLSRLQISSASSMAVVFSSRHVLIKRALSSCLLLVVVAATLLRPLPLFPLCFCVFLSRSALGRASVSSILLSSSPPNVPIVERVAEREKEK